MSLENQVAVLSQNVGNLVNRVTTQANQWDAQIAQAVQTVNNYVTNAKLLSDNREIRQFKVLGSVDLFYPVIFTTVWREPVELQIFRKNLHYDANLHGSLFFELHFMPSNGGNEGNYLRLTKHIYAYRMFVARYTAQFYHSKIIVWLRGQTTYDWSCNYFNTEVDYDATPKTLTVLHMSFDYNVLNAVDTDLQTTYFGFGR